jgi:hypothetical protein
VEGGEHGGAVRDGSSMNLPSFRYRNDGEILRAATIHYNGNKCSFTMMVLNLASRDPPHRLIKTPSVDITAVLGGGGPRENNQWGHKL